MDPKVFAALEYLFIGALLVAVLYAGGVFGDNGLTGPEPTPTPRTVVATQAATPAAPPPATAAPPRPPTLTPAPTEPPLTYTIAPGDTCLGIADQFDISLDSLIRVNNLDGSCFIRAGDTLIVPRPTADAFAP